MKASRARGRVLAIGCPLLLAALHVTGGALPGNGAQAQEASVDSPMTPTPTTESKGPSPLIVGGGTADPGEWPWQVVLVAHAYENPWMGHFCGGTLVSPTRVVTAAHCVEYDTSAGDTDVIAGIYDLWEPAPGYQRRTISHVILHPDYNPNTLFSDIALLQLSSPVSIGGTGETATALLPLVEPAIGDLAGDSGWATGWGETQGIPEYPVDLREVQLPIVTNAQCNEDYYGGSIGSDEMCAGFVEGGYSTCYGDSGGPLAIFDTDVWKLAGITSHGGGSYLCGSPTEYSVFTRVSVFTNWVLGHMGPIISGNAGIADATVTYTGGSTITNSIGDYYFDVIPGWTGTVTPSKPNYVFSPPGTTYNNVTADQVGQDYLAWRRLFSDFDRDGITDPVKWDDADSAWWLRSSNSAWDGVYLGPGTYVSRSDFDGDAATDPAKFDASNSLWYYGSSSDMLHSLYAGPGTYLFVGGSDFDSDQITDPAQFNNTVNSLWYYGSDDSIWHGVYLGPGTYDYVTGSDFDGDGMSDPAHFDSSSNVLWYMQSSDSTWYGVYTGPGTYQYVEASDFDGDGMTDAAQFTASSNTLWYVPSSGGGVTGVWMGGTPLTYVPAADFDGDGMTDPAGFDAVTHLIWYLPSGGGGWQTYDMGAGTYTIVN